MASRLLPLSGMTVLELSGLAPVPFCGKILLDFGAEVFHISKGSSDSIDVLYVLDSSSGKKSIVMDLKQPAHKEIFLHMIKQSDVLLDPYRPGVLEKFGLSPESLLALNKRLIVARLSGWGHTGPLASAPGHDLNYLSITGVLSTLGTSPEAVPYPPHNLLADMAGGGLTCAMGILMCLIERQRSGLGQIIDAAMVDGTIYLSSILFHMKQLGLWQNEAGKNLLDSGAFFYSVYKCADGKCISLACLEPRFYAAFLKALLPHLSDTQKQAVSAIVQYDEASWEQSKRTLAAIFAGKGRDEWTEIVSP